MLQGVVCSEFSRREMSRAMAAALVTALFQRTAEAAEDSKEQVKKDGVKPDSDPIYDPGGDVKPPKLVHYVEPAFSSSSKEAFVEGTVKISTIVSLEGRATESSVLRGLNAEEDQTAVDAVMQWRFEPGKKNGKAVKVRVTVEVDFHLL